MSEIKPISPFENKALNTNEKGGLVLELRMGDRLIFNEEFLVEVTLTGLHRLRIRCFSEDPKKYKIRRVFR